MRNIPRNMTLSGSPASNRGLYSAANESDACGAGFICNLKGERSRRIVTQALEILVNLTHRGACGCDEKTGDGAGLLFHVPHRFLKKACDFHIPDEFDYGTGLVFLPNDAAQRRHCTELFEDVVRREGQDFLGWRDVPVNNAGIGEVARMAEPTVSQIVIGRGAGIEGEAEFERKLYVIRKVMEQAIRESDLPQKSSFYLPSLSSRTVVYKGMLLADQIESYFPDLQDPDFVSGLALVHQRYSTNTFPNWELAQPFRFLCHNGEINTLRGNINWLNARQYLFSSPLFGDDIAKLFPIATPGASDSAILDNAIELLYHSGRTLPHCVMMLIPEAWQNHGTMTDEKKAFYEYHSMLSEPWDGPASIPFTDGKCIGAVLDRNGLRPSRYWVTKDGFVVMSSETGVIEIEAENVLSKGRLEPGRMFLVDTDKGRIVDDTEIKDEICTRRPYRTWLNTNMSGFDKLPPPVNVPKTNGLTLLTRQQAFGYSLEDLNVIMGPMAVKGKEPTGSMGDDIPPAILSKRPRLLYDYFKQLFAQVTNPPLDAIREELVTSLVTNIGSEQDLFDETPEHCRQFKLEQPVLTDALLHQLRSLDGPGFKSVTLPMVYPVSAGGAGLEKAIDTLCAQASDAVDAGATIVILSDRGIARESAAIPAMLATAAVHHHLIREGKRTRCGLVIDSAEPREVHHFAMLFAFGAGAVNPYLALATLQDLVARKLIDVDDYESAEANYIKALGKGFLKVMSKMGISTLHSYRGAQIVECIGLNEELVDRYFTWTASRIGGADIDLVAEEIARRHVRGFPSATIHGNLQLDVGGKYKWRRNGEVHQYNPLTVSKLQHAARINDRKTFKEYSDLIHSQNREQGALRGLLEFKTDNDPIPLDEVEPWTEIVKRFKTGGMSYGSISKESHQTLAVAMNRLGGKSNSGEGGEDEDRFTPDENGDWRNSAIKQVASGRFGVTSNYLVNAQEIQIKMAQGAKPGEGGQLPGFKVYPWIAKTRHSTPYVGLISPPPHHDIYSIEDLAQLIHDLKNSNPDARINVKLVSEVGVGTVAAGVAKGKADVVLISGSTGGTGASAQTSIKYAGLPWELGLAETHQTLVMNDLRSRIVVECDGQIKTGRDVAIACLLGAEEFGFATSALITIGCIMMRVCHLNTCPVGIATQDPELRKKFEGKPDYVVNFLHFVAEELREIMAQLGFRTVNEMIGQVDRLDVAEAIDHWKAKGLDFSRILHKPEAGPGVGVYCTQKQDHGLDKALDHELIRLAKPALEKGEKVEETIRIKNINRTVGTMLSSQVSRRYGEAGLPDNTIVFNCHGSAGQSFCAFGARGITMNIFGDANDYFGKGLSGARLVVRPPDASTFVAEENVIIGNVAFYGATSGVAYIRGLAGERFCVRNSGVHAVVEGVGDHCCEYMTGGRVVVLGPTGRNFAAGMSGGIAYVLDEDGDFGRDRCNLEMVELEPVDDAADIAELRGLIENHRDATGSAPARRILDNWDASLKRFSKVMPTDYKRALAQLAEEAEAAGRTEAVLS